MGNLVWINNRFEVKDKYKKNTYFASEPPK